MSVSRKNKTLKKLSKSSKYSKLSKNGNRKIKKNIRKMKGGGENNVNNLKIYDLKTQEIHIKNIPYTINIPTNLIINDKSSLNHRGLGGGHGEVYSGKWNDIDVAIKLIIKMNSKNNNIILNEINNFKIASGLQIGPHVYYTNCCEEIEYYDLIRIGYVVMELVDDFKKYVKTMKTNNKPLEDLLNNIGVGISNIANILVDNEYTFADANTGNFGFRKQDNKLLLLDLETLFFNETKDMDAKAIEKYKDNTKQYLDSTLSDDITKLYKKKINKQLIN